MQTLEHGTVYFARNKKLLLRPSGLPWQEAGQRHWPVDETVPTIQRVSQPLSGRAHWHVSRKSAWVALLDWTPAWRSNLALWLWSQMDQWQKSKR